MSELKYKVGDKVLIKSIDWYNKNKDEYGNIDVSHYFTFYADRSKYCGKVFTIDEVFDNWYTVKEDNHEYYWTDEMIECKVIQLDTKTKSENKLLDEYEELTDRAFKGGYEKCKSDIELNGFQLPEGYQFVDENGNEIFTSKIILKKKKKEYPKTYEECAEIIAELTGSDCNPKGCMGYMSVQLTALQKLLICRDAYWKIAGEEMGLGKPWEPDFTNDDEERYGIYTVANKVVKDFCGVGDVNTILTFPTEEMRDAFKENFDPDIEICKEFL